MLNNVLPVDKEDGIDKPEHFPEHMQVLPAVKVIAG